MKNKAAFFDRDGTLIEDKDYLGDPKGVELLGGAPELCQFLQNRGYNLYIVTNQSGVARGYFDEAAVHRVNEEVRRQFDEHNITFLDISYCPHHPSEATVAEYGVDCFCRKPSPGMILELGTRHAIDLPQSLMFGDKQSDWDAGIAAGCQSFDIKRVLKHGFVR